MSTVHPTGIQDPERPSHWLVPPWPGNAEVHDVIGHFLRSAPRIASASPRQQLRYYQGYLAAMDAAPKYGITDRLTREWYDALRDSLMRCEQNCRAAVAIG